MTEVGFYHLTRSTLGQALPQLLVRTLAAGQRAVVLGASTAGLQELSAALWSNPAWLPHGAVPEGDADLQPIWLSTDPASPNGARYLFLVEGADTDRVADYDRVFNLFDGNDPVAVTAARNQWKSWKQAGHALAYWQQTEAGWQKTTT